MKIVTFDPNKCVGCHNCEYACAFHRTKLTCLPKEANIRVDHFPGERVLIAMTCMHCEDAWCLNVCPAGAISRDPETKAVVIDSTKCAGCKMCMLACPYGNITFDPENLVSRKCDLCGGDPKCVGHCISGALQFVEAEEAYDFKKVSTTLKLKDAIIAERNVQQWLKE